MKSTKKGGERREQESEEEDQAEEVDRMKSTLSEQMTRATFMVFLANLHLLFNFVYA